MGKITPGAVTAQTTRKTQSASFDGTPTACWQLDRPGHVPGRFFKLKESDIVLNGGGEVAITLETFRFPIDKPKNLDPNSPKVYTFYRSRDFLEGVGTDRFFNFASKWLESVEDDEEMQKAIYELFSKKNKFLRKPDGKPYRLSDLTENRKYVLWCQTKDAVEVAEDGTAYSDPVSEDIQAPYFFEVTATLLNKIVAKYDEPGLDDMWNEVESADIYVNHTTEKKEGRYTLSTRLKHAVTVFGRDDFYTDELKPSMAEKLQEDEFTEDLAIQAFKKMFAIGAEKRTPAARPTRTARTTTATATEPVEAAEAAETAEKAEEKAPTQRPRARGKAKVEVADEDPDEDALD